jgi:hypothetical protein
MTHGQIAAGMNAQRPAKEMVVAIVPTVTAS